jgi:pentalenene oxygenase
MKRRPGEFLLSLQSGEPVTVIQLGPRPMYVVNDPALIRQVLRDAETFGRGGPITERFRQMFGNGLGISDGDFHQRQRSLIQPAFHHARIVHYVSLMSRAVEEKADSWQDGQRLAVDKEMDDLALTNVTQAIFSGDATLDRTEFMAATTVVLGGLFKRVTSAGLLNRLPTPGNRRYQRAEEYLRRSINQVISDYRASGVDHGDLLSMMLLARGDDGEPAMSDQQLHDEVMTFFIAGSNTISNTLAWAFHEVATHPDVERRLHAEVDRVSSDPSSRGVGLAGRAAEFGDVAQLEYAKRVITETLRMRTQGLFLSRFTTTAAELGGYHIPAGASVLYSFHALNHNPAIHPDPERFDPDRWLPERAKAIPRGGFMPFGIGTYNCIGDQFAWTEMIVSLATIAARWRLVSVPGHQPRPKLAITMPVDALPMTAERRT